MMDWRLSDILQATGGELLGADRAISGKWSVRLAMWWRLSAVLRISRDRSPSASPDFSHTSSQASPEAQA